MKQLTEFGKATRKYRIDVGITLKQMAQQLGVSSAFLSAVERGKKNVPMTWSAKLPASVMLASVRAEISNLEHRLHELNIMAKALEAQS